MNVLVTGGAGFIGRAVVKRLLEDRHKVYVLDNLSNGSKDNLIEFEDCTGFKGLIVGDIRDEGQLNRIFKRNIDICVHMAAQVNVQASIDHPEENYDINVNGTFRIMESARKTNTKVVLVSTCMVYAPANTSSPITEGHRTMPASPYAGSKLAAENLAGSYYYAYGLPVVILRPFNIYGPFQKTNMEGGVVSIFVSRKIRGEKLPIFGQGNQTRDLMFVDDCADFIVKASYSPEAGGEIFNAGSGKDISVNDLAMAIVKEKNMIKHVPHPHPQSEINKMVCDNRKSRYILGWKPRISLTKGIERLEKWLREATV